MRKLKINLLAIIGMMVAVGTLAFTAPKEKALEELHWFEVTQNTNNENVFGDAIPTGEDGLPALACESTIDLTPLCAVGLDESQIDGSGEPAPTVSPDDAKPVNKRYREE